MRGCTAFDVVNYQTLQTAVPGGSAPSYITQLELNNISELIFDTSKHVLRYI